MENCMSKKKKCRYPLCHNYERGIKVYCGSACEAEHITYKALKLATKLRAAGKAPTARKLRVLVCGSRHWTLRKVMRRELLELKDRIELVIEGGATGADTMGREEAWKLGLPVFTMSANWVFQGRSAGPIRNRWMLKYGQPDLVLAFHLNIDDSKGTKDMIKAAKRSNIKVKLVEA
jgi:hypothetical protein